MTAWTWARRSTASILATSLIVFAPALLGLTLVVVCAIWLSLTSLIAPTLMPAQYAQGAAGMLWGWVFLSTNSFMAIGFVKCLQNPSMPLSWLRTALIWGFGALGPALLWMVNATWLIQALAHSEIAAADRLQMQLVLVLWLAVTAMVTAVGLLCRRKSG